MAGFGPDLETAGTTSGGGDGTRSRTVPGRAEESETVIPLLHIMNHFSRRLRVTAQVVREALDLHREGRSVDVPIDVVALPDPDQDGDEASQFMERDALDRDVAVARCLTC